MAVDTDTRCPCGSGKDYLACCGPYLDGTAIPALPEELMRSRYTAFCKRNVDYLIATYHPSQREPNDRRLLTETGGETAWLSLRLLQATQSARANTGTVEFVAFYRKQGAVGQMHEKSDFVREDGNWFYLHGVQMEPITVGRNDPCWCGSGRKLKQCHNTMPTPAQSS